MSQNLNKSWKAENAAYRKLNASQKKRAKIISKTLNGFSIFFMLSVFLYPVFNFKLQVIISLSLPIITFYLAYYFEELKLLSYEHSMFSGFSKTLAIAFLLVIIQGGFYFSILDYSNAWWITIVIATLLSYFLIKTTNIEMELQEESKMIRNIVFTFLTFIISCYTFCAVILINCTFDNSDCSTNNSKCEVIESGVIDKYSRTSRRVKVYYIEAEIPEIYGKTESFQISKDDWNRVNKGEKVELEIRHGLFGIVWVEVFVL